MDLPVTFIITNHRQRKNEFIDKLEVKLSESNITTSRIAIIFLENSSFDFKVLPSDQFVAVTILNKNCIKYHNFTSGYIDLRSEVWDYIPTDTKRYMTERIDLEKSISKLSKAEQAEKIKNFEHFEKVKGNSLEIRELLPQEVSENMNLYDPTFIRLLRYELVFYLGK